MGVWWVVAKLKQRSKKTQIVEFRVATVYDMYMYPQRTNIALQGLERHALTVGAILGPHSQIGAFVWRYFTSRGFTWLVKLKYSGEADQSTLASGGSEHA